MVRAVGEDQVAAVLELIDGEPVDESAAVRGVDARSRCRVGWCEFSARLLRYLDCRCSTDGITARCATG